MGSSRIKLGVSGALGKMGARILALALEDKFFKVILALERQGHPQLGESLAGVKVISDRDMIRQIDCLIDFSSPEATLDNLRYATRYKKAVVIGTTGFSEEQKKVISTAAKKIPVLFSPNMSIGVNVIFDLVAQAASKLPKEYMVRMVEAHHIHKKDAPSGTAKYLSGIISLHRKDPCVDIKSIREGEIIGDHEVVFESPSDIIVLSHHAKTRDIFVKGALEAAKFVFKKKKGLYGMADMLGFAGKRAGR